LPSRKPTGTKQTLMKNTSLLLGLILLANLTCEAHEPIERTVEQITLGKTLKVQAARILKEKGLNVGNKIWDFREHPEEMPVQIDDSIRHIGQEWDGILFNTTSGKVIYRLCFLQRERDSSQIDTTFKEVKLYLKEKYSVYLTEDTDYNTTYSDEKTEVSLWKTSNTSLRLCYYATTLTEEE